MREFRRFTLKTINNYIALLLDKCYPFGMSEYSYSESRYFKSLAGVASPRRNNGAIPPSCEVFNVLRQKVSSVLNPYYKPNESRLKSREGLSVSDGVTTYKSVCFSLPRQVILF